MAAFWIIRFIIQGLFPLIAVGLLYFQIAYDGDFSKLLSGENTLTEELEEPTTPAINVQQLLDVMDNPEYDYYQKILNYSMDAMRSGQAYEWKSYASRGVITPSDAYTSNSGAVCREFAEKLIHKGWEADERALACRRIDSDGRPDGWCRLPLGEAGTCAMEAPRTEVGNLVREVQDTLQNDISNTRHQAQDYQENYQQEYNRREGKVEGWFERNWPF